MTQGVRHTKTHLSGRIFQGLRAYLLGAGQGPFLKSGLSWECAMFEKLTPSKLTLSHMEEGAHLSVVAPLYFTCPLTAASSLVSWPPPLPHVNFAVCKACPLVAFAMASRVTFKLCDSGWDILLPFSTPLPPLPLIFALGNPSCMWISVQSPSFLRLAPVFAPALLSGTLLSSHFLPLA